MTTAAFYHRRGVINGDNFASRMRDIATHGKRRGAERAAKIVNLSVWLNKTLSQHADHRNNIGVTRNGALDHIREDFGYPFIKGPVAETGDRRGKKRVAVRHNVKPEKTKTAYCALTQGENQLPGHIPQVSQHHQQQRAPGGAHSGTPPAEQAMMETVRVHQASGNQQNTANVHHPG